MPPVADACSFCEGQGHSFLCYIILAMYSLEPLKIDLNGLKEGETTFEYDLDDAYFEAVDAPEVRRGNVHVDLVVNRTGGVYSLDFHNEGTVHVPCDLCLDDMEQQISADNSLTARLGEEYSEDDDLVTVGKDEGLLDVSWYIYEFIALAIPIKHVHAPGKCNPAMIKVLEEHSAARSSDGGGEQAADSRWSELEKLKTIIKD